MLRLLTALAVALVAAPLLSVLLASREDRVIEQIRPPAVATDSARPSLGAPRMAAEPRPSFTAPGEDSVFQVAAEAAWRYVESQYQPRTGLVNSVIHYPYATVWDIGSTLAAFYSAHELGFLPSDDYHARTARLLQTLAEMPLFSNAAFNKNYHVSRGTPAGRSDRELTQGYGWSATDMGRLLVWLRIVANGHPQHLPAIEEIVGRLAFDRLVKEGYLWGEDLGASGRRRAYQEGRLGYEQYAAAGFALWGHYAERALSVIENSDSLHVLGTPILVDRREGAHLTSEPFVLLGLEVGYWSPQWEQLAESILAVQEARYEQTGQFTIVSEDAVPVAPNYFYYYTIHNRGTDFAVVSLTGTRPLSGPRWISSKAAFGWYAIRPGPYTWEAVQRVVPAINAQAGWSSGVYERTGEPTGGQNINTSAVILEAALYRKLGRPLLSETAGT